VNAQPGASRPDWVSKLVLPIAVAVLGAILVTALTPLGENLRELLFPTKADVSGSVTVDGQRAAGAQLVLDSEPAGATDEEGTFILRDIGDGDHTLEIKAVSSRLKRQAFTIERGASKDSLGEIKLPPLAQLGYSESLSGTQVGLAHDVTLWIIAELDALQRIQSVQYALPAPFPPTVVSVANAAQTAFCLRRKITSQNVGIRLPTAIVDLGQGRTFSISSPGGGQSGARPCRLTGGNGSQPSPPGPPPPPPGPRPPPSPPGPLPPPPPAIVPGVTGQPFDEAQSLLRNRGFVVIRKDVVSEEAVDTVVFQSPSAGTTHRRGSKVTLSVSAGPAVLVPDVIKLSREDAIAMLEEAEFKVKEVGITTDDAIYENVVLQQAPAAGTEAVRRSTVTIYVGQLEER
jgi:hypothetical protein